MNGVVLAIHGQQRHSAPPHGGHHHFSRCHQHFLIRQRNIFAVLDGLIRRAQPHHSHGRRHHRLGLRVRGHALDAFRAEYNFQRRLSGAPMLKRGAQARVPRLV